MEPPRIPRSLRVRRSRASPDADERFARAVEAGEVGRSGEFADELAVVAALRDLGNRGAGTADPDTVEHGTGVRGGVAPSDERDGSLTPAARMRITDRVLAPHPQAPAPQTPDTEPGTAPSPAALRTVEGDPAVERTAGPRPESRPEPRPTGDGPGPRRRRTHAVAAGAAALVAVGAVALGAADDARPGESLYALKQLHEGASLAMTFDDEARAFHQLGYASDRITELRSLADDGALDRPALHAGLADFTDGTRSAVAELTTLATTSGGEQLDRIRTWASDQAARIAPLPDAAEETELLSRVERRALALDERMSCLRITSGDVDDLGVLPTTGTCRTAPQAGASDEPSPVPPPDDDPGSDDERPGDLHSGDDPATLVGSDPEHVGEPSDVATPVHATPPWTPASRVPSAHVVRAVPEPPTGPRLPDERPRPPGELSLSTILAGITGLDSPHR